MSAVLLVVTDPNCVHCQIYKTQEHSKLVQLVNRDRQMKLEVLTIVPTGTGGYRYQSSTGKAVHPEIYDSSKWGDFSPRFILVSGSSWTDHHRPIDGHIMGLDRSQAGKLLPNDEYSKEAEKIYAWATNRIRYTPDAGNVGTESGGSSDHSGDYHGVEIRYDGIYSTRQ